MVREDILKKLKLVYPSLVDQYGICELGLFGSVLRSDFGPQSDVDILVSFSRPIGFEIVDMVMFLEKELSRSVDLVTKKSLLPPLKEIIEDEVVYV